MRGCSNRHRNGKIDCGVRDVNDPFGLKADLCNAKLMSAKGQQRTSSAHQSFDDLSERAGMSGSHPPSIQCRFVIPCDSSASMTPSKISATPIADTKKPTMRVIASIPIGPNVFESLLA